MVWKDNTDRTKRHSAGNGLWLEPHLYEGP